MSNIPSSNIEQLLEVSIDSKLVDVHTCLPGKIVNFNAETQLAQIQIQINRIFEDENSNESFSQIPVLVDVPLLFTQTQDFTITVPVKPGDECIVFFSERDIDHWHNNGDISNPRTRRRFDFSDGFCLPMVSSLPNKISNYNPDNLEIRKKDGTSKIVIKSNGDIEIFNSSKIDVTTPELNINANVNITGTLDVDGNIDASGDVKSGSIVLGTHLHGGVQTGGDNTTGPV
jgi:hypothetical protein